MMREVRREGGEEGWEKEGGKGEEGGRREGEIKRADL